MIRVPPAVAPPARSVAEVRFPSLAALSSGGAYYQPEACEVEIAGEAVDCSRGVIAVNCGENPHADDAGTIAHELRHHWQWWRGWGYDGVGWHQPGGDYRADIVRYFIRSRCEMDALLFEHRLAPCDVTEEWLDWLREAQA